MIFSQLFIMTIMTMTTRKPLTSHQSLKKKIRDQTIYSLFLQTSYNPDCGRRESISDQKLMDRQPTQVLDYKLYAGM